MKARQIYVPVFAVIVFLALWEALVWAMGWPNYKMASPSDLIPAYEKYWDLFLIMGWQTLWRTVVGLLLAVVFGIALGMVMGFSRVMRDALYPLLVGFNAVPKATVVPIVALMFVGAHDFNTVLIAFMISFFPSRFLSRSGCRRWNRNTATSCGRLAHRSRRSSGRSHCPRPCRSFSAH